MANKDKINKIKEELKKYNNSDIDTAKPPFYYKIKEIINNIISSGYKPLTNDDWEIYGCGNRVVFDNGVVEEESVRNWDFILKTDGGIEVIESNWTGFLQYPPVGKYEKTPIKSRSYECSIDTLIYETDYDFSHTVKDGNKTIYINHSTEWLQFNTQRDLVPYSLNITENHGRRLYYELDRLYKKVLDTPRRRNELIAKRKAEIEAQHKRLEEKRLKLEQKRKEEEKRKIEEERRKKEEERRQQEKARIEEERRQQEIKKYEEKEQKFKLLKLKCVLITVLFQIVVLILYMHDCIIIYGKNFKDFNIVLFILFLPALLYAISIIEEYTIHFSRCAVALNIILLLALLLSNANLFSHYIFIMIVMVLQSVFVLHSRNELQNFYYE